MMYLTQGLRRACTAFPQRPAIVFEGRTTTYRQLHDRVARLAAALAVHGVRPGDRVAMLSNNQARYVEYFLAVYWCGGVVNPVNTRWNAEEIAYSLADSDTRCLIVDKANLHLVTGITKCGARLDWVMGAADEPIPELDLDFEQLVDSAAPIEDVLRGGSDIAGIFYTGGTTGFPKGVVLSHQNLYVNAMAMAGHGIVSSDPVALHVAPMFHLAGSAFMNAVLGVAGTQVICPQFSPTAVFDLIESARCTETLLVPTIIQMLVDAYDPARHDVGSLQSIAYGASPISETVLTRVMSKWPHVRLYQAYGQTELGPLATVLQARDHTPDGSAKLKSAGTPAMLAEVKIVDSVMCELPVGQVGEIVVKGPGVMLGYWNKPEETAEVLVDGWMRTGDAGRADADGYIYVVDRLKDMIISGGENVYSAEVENALMSHEAVAACAVIGIPSATWGESVHAIVALRPNSDASLTALQNHCKGLIASYKVPRTVDFVDALPTSGAGKILKTVLRVPFWEKAGRAVA